MSAFIIWSTIWTFVIGFFSALVVVSILEDDDNDDGPDANGGCIRWYADFGRPAYA